MEPLSFEEWLSGVRAPVTTAHIFKRPDLIAELGKLQGLKERGQHPELFEPTLGERSRLDQVRRELEESLVIFHFAPIDEDDDRAVLAAHPDPDGEPVFSEAPPALPQRATDKQSEAFLAAHRAWQERKEAWARENREVIADYQRRLTDVATDRGAERLARSLVAIEEGDVKRDVRWTADQIKQLRRRIGGPQLGLLIEAMQEANTKAPEVPDPLD